MGPLDLILRAIVEQRGEVPAHALDTLHRVHTPSGQVYDLLPPEWHRFRREARRLRSEIAADNLSRNRKGRRRRAALKR